jgi:hypothetical protein
MGSNPCLWKIFFKIWIISIEAKIVEIYLGIVACAIIQQMGG